MHMRWRLASSTMLHVNPKVRGQHPRRLERRAGSPPLSSRWSSDERRDHRLPARSAHHWPAGVRWWRLPPPNATSEWTGDECAHFARTVCAPKHPYPVSAQPSHLNGSGKSCPIIGFPRGRCRSTMCPAKMLILRITTETVTCVTERVGVRAQKGNAWRVRKHAGTRAGRRQRTRRTRWRATRRPCWWTARCFWVEMTDE
jgi:hypothetical protein